MDITYNLNGSFQPTIKRNVDVGGADFYPTPAWATYALVDNEKFEGNIWECACGDGAMSKVLEESGYKVISSDLHDRGFGKANIDFLEQDNKVDNVITNPPYNSAEGFLKKALDISEGKVALLLRLAFLEGINRNKTIFSITPPTRVWVFSERITFYPKNKERKGGGTTAYAWFVWDKKNTQQTELKWLPVGYKNAKAMQRHFSLEMICH